MFPKTISFRVHAVKRMFERNITANDITIALSKAKVLKEYLDDKPYPSYLILGWCENRPIHIVVAINKEENVSIIITVYEPSPDEWVEGYIKRLDKR
jgi:hypothetical protein